MGQIADETLAVARDLLSRAMKSHSEGKLDAAEELYRQVLEYEYRVTDVLPLVAGVAAAAGRLEAALTFWDELLILRPGYQVALLQRGAISLKIGDVVAAIESYSAVVGSSPTNTIALNNLAVAFAQADRQYDALKTFQKLMEIEPADIRVRHQVRRLTAGMVPFWHIPMLNDVQRNDAFEVAIGKAIAMRGSDARILDIGTGSGLLSMMAARAGSSDIVTCEAVPIIAEAAERIIAQNGFSDQISLIKKKSTELVVGEDLEARAHILVSEILSSDLLAEGVLDTFEDAYARLLTDDVTVIPRAATAVGCIVESSILSKYVFVDEVSGFDISTFSALAAIRLPVHGTMTDWKRLSADVDFQTIDLTRKKHTEELRLVEVPIISGGLALGVVQWMRIDLAEGVEFSNHPDDYSDGGWLQVLHPFPAAINVKAGSMLRMLVGHDRNSLILIPTHDEL